ncbi:MAG: PAS domain S-box protein [Verrucomicrobiales bacterium]|nr:PAS domain S-box protein [Verrucomicrobiales bacterium]
MIAHQEWKLWKPSPEGLWESLLLRYGAAFVLTGFTVLLVLRVPGLSEAPYFMLLGTVILSAFYGGVGPSLLSLALSTVAVLCLFLRSDSSVPLIQKLNLEEAARLIAFGWVALTISLLIAGSRRSRRDLRQSEERYRALVQTSPDAIATVDAKGMIIFVTPAAGKLFQCSCEQMLGLPLALFVPGCLCQSHLAGMRNNLDTRKSGEAIHFSGRNLHGEVIPLEIAFSAFSNGQDVFTAFIRRGVANHPSFEAHRRSVALVAAAKEKMLLLPSCVAAEQSPAKKLHA